MLKVGITGGMGTGKSTVCKIFNTLGIPTFDADKEAKALYSTNDELREKVIQRFGLELYERDVFQIAKMAKIVFNDKAALQDLNAMVHPLIINQSIDWFAVQKTNYAIKEAALLIESGGAKEMDKIILVQTPLEERIERIKSRDGKTAKEIENRMSKQMPEEEKVAYADFIINNSSSDLLIPQVLDVHSKLLELCD